MTGLSKQKENKFKSLWEVGSRLAKLVLAQKWCSKRFLLPCWSCQRERCLSEYTGNILTWKSNTFPASQWGDDELPANLHLLSVCFNYIGQVKVQHSGMLCRASDSSSSSWSCLLPIITKSGESLLYSQLFVCLKILQSSLGSSFGWEGVMWLTQDHYKFL